MKSNEEYRRQAYDTVKKNLWDILLPLIIFSIVTGVLSQVAGIFAPQFDNTVFPPVEINPGNPPVYSLFNFIIFVVSTYIAFSVLHLFIQVAKDQKPELEDVLLKGLKEQPINAPILTFLTSLFVGLWSLLFIIPGIVKSYAYSLGTLILIQDKDIRVTDILNKSQELMRGKKMQLFLLDLSYFGWYLLSLFTLGILLIWVVPRHQTARTLFLLDAYEQR